MNGKIVSLLGLLMVLGMSEGVSFVRWGRTVCPEGTIVLHKGYMVGPHFNSGGNGANYLCANEKPVFVRGVPGFQNGAGVVWGSEFAKRPGLENQFQSSNVASGNLDNQDMPCVRCYSTDSDMFVNIGRPDCGDLGYNVQYKGFLVAESNLIDRFRSEYVCLDEAPEGITGGTGNNDQSVLYPVEFACGSLPCNPYVSGMEATCAVCTF